MIITNVLHTNTDMSTILQECAQTSTQNKRRAFLLPSFFSFCLADVNQSFYPLLFRFISKFKIPQPSGLYLRTHPPLCFSWYRCGLFIKVRQQEIPQIFRGPAIRRGSGGQVKQKKARAAKTLLYMVTENQPQKTEKWDPLTCWEK